METIKKSTFRLDRFIISECNIKRKPIKQGIPSIDIKPSGLILNDKKTFQLNLHIDLSDNVKSFEISLVVIGIFKLKDEETEKTLNNFFFVNAPAIIFPYVRSYISALTALSGLNVINLPLMNLTPLGEKLKANTKIAKAKDENQIL